MTEPAVRIERVVKEYSRRRGWLNALVGALPPPVSHLARRNEADMFRAVDDVSFEIEPGEAFGIIGPNGGGKSTLLKLTAGITRPTSGRVVTRGRIGSLIEVGAGFHSELTGRENVFLAGALLGMTRADVRAVYDDVVAFAETGPAMDTPVKHYSSGMYVRLGFSLAVHARVDVLIVDEVLAVGDAVFVSRCLNRIGELKRRGTTIVLVSHDMGQVLHHCTRVAHIEHGALDAVGPAQEVVSRYLARAARRSSVVQSTAVRTEAVGSGGVRITAVALTDDAGRTRESFAPDEPVNVHVTWAAGRPVLDPVVEYEFMLDGQLPLLRSSSRLDGFSLGMLDGHGGFRLRLPALPLNHRSVSVTLSLWDGAHAELFDRASHVVWATIEADRGHDGILSLRPQWFAGAGSPP